MNPSLLRDYSVPILAGFLSLFIIGWVPAVYFIDSIQFSVLTPAAHVGVEAASAVARLFAALVLLLLPKAQYGRGIRWLAMGFVVLGLGSLLFGSFPYAFGYQVDSYESIYGSLAISIIAAVLVLIGLVPEYPPRLKWFVVGATLGLVAIFKVIAFTRLDLLPPLWEDSSGAVGSTTLSSPLEGVTEWYWILMPLPFLLVLASAIAGSRLYAQGKLPGWLAIALVFWAGAQLHNVVWPSTYSLIVTTTDILRFSFAMVIVVAGILALRQSAQEYARLFEIEQQMHHRLSQSAALKDDFTSMVAHELGSPVSAIRRFTEIIETGDLDAHQRRSVEAILRETGALRKLVSDVQAIASIESDEFSVDLKPVSVSVLVEEATTIAVTVCEDHPFITRTCEQIDRTVLADEVRIGQVLRNLLENAAKYSPAGTPIEIRVQEHGRIVSFQVVDQGSGIDPGDLDRIFEKFERGVHGVHDVPRRNGAGLGLYLSRRIIRAHGSEIRVVSQPGEGSTFTFTLEFAS